MPEPKQKPKQTDARLPGASPAVHPVRVAPVRPIESLGEYTAGLGDHVARAKAESRETRDNLRYFMRYSSLLDESVSIDLALKELLHDQPWLTDRTLDGVDIEEVARVVNDVVNVAREATPDQKTREEARAAAGQDPFDWAAGEEGGLAAGAAGQVLRTRTRTDPFAAHDQLMSLVFAVDSGLAGNANRLTAFARSKGFPTRLESAYYRTVAEAIAGMPAEGKERFVNAVRATVLAVTREAVKTITDTYGDMQRTRLSGGSARTVSEAAAELAGMGFYYGKYFLDTAKMYDSWVADPRIGKTFFASTDSFAGELLGKSVGGLQRPHEISEELSAIAPGIVGTAAGRFLYGRGNFSYGDLLAKTISKYSGGDAADWRSRMPGDAWDFRRPGLHEGHDLEMAFGDFAAKGYENTVPIIGEPDIKRAFSVPDPDMLVRAAVESMASAVLRGDAPGFWDLKPEHLDDMAMWHRAFRTPTEAHASGAMREIAGFRRTRDGSEALNTEALFRRDRGTPVTMLTMFAVQSVAEGLAGAGGAPKPATGRVRALYDAAGSDWWPFVGTDEVINMGYGMTTGSFMTVADCVDWARTGVSRLAKAYRMSKTMQAMMPPEFELGTGAYGEVMRDLVMMGPEGLKGMFVMQRHVPFGGFIKDAGLPLGKTLFQDSPDVGRGMSYPSFAVNPTDMRNGLGDGYGGIGGGLSDSRGIHVVMRADPKMFVPKVDANGRATFVLSDRDFYSVSSSASPAEAEAEAKTLAQKAAPGGGVSVFNGEFGSAKDGMNYVVDEPSGELTMYPQLAARMMSYSGEHSYAEAASYLKYPAAVLPRVTPEIDIVLSRPLSTWGEADRNIIQQTVEQAKQAGYKVKFVRDNDRVISVPGVPGKFRSYDSPFSEQEYELGDGPDNLPAMSLLESQAASEYRLDDKGGDSANRRDLSNFLATDEVPDTLFGVPVISDFDSYSDADLEFFQGHPTAGGYYDMGDSAEGTRQDAKGGGSKSAMANFLATDEVPGSLFGIPVTSTRDQYTEGDISFFEEHPEAGGYYDMGQEG